MYAKVIKLIIVLYFVLFKYIFAKVIKSIIVLYFIPIKYIFINQQSFYISYQSNIYLSINNRFIFHMNQIYIH